MNRLARFAIILSTLAIILPAAGAASGYGTSSISVSQTSVNITAGGSAIINYTVSIASGNTWGTVLTIENNAYLASQSIMFNPVSSAEQDPPFSGHISIMPGSAAIPGSYQVILQATGDDPSTSNATIMVNVQAPAPTTTIAKATNSTGNSTTAATTTIQAAASTSVNYYSGNPGGEPSYAMSGGMTLLLAVIAIIIIIGAILMAIMKPKPTKLIILGVILILIGVAVWLYGDYNGGLMAYIWGGVAAILVGTIVWLAGDAIAGAFIRAKK